MERTRQQRVSVAENILELVGRTPMVKLNRLVQPDWADVYVKLEKFNPGGSVKDRTALNLILDAEKRGVLKPGATIIEPTSGNTGIGLALVGAARNYETILVMPDNMSQERIKLLKGYGAKVVLTPGRERMPGAIKKAEELAKEIPNSFMPYQFQNEANPEVHRNTTGPEILEQMEGKIDAFVATAGTGGTITGTGEYLKSHLPDLFIAVVEPENSPSWRAANPDRTKFRGQAPGLSRRC